VAGGVGGDGGGDGMESRLIEGILILIGEGVRS
jgi:hypothetical protein